MAPDRGDVSAERTAELDARARELDLLQRFAAAAAEACTPGELFHAIARALQQVAEPDVVLAVWWNESGHGEACAYLARHARPRLLARLTREALAICDVSSPALPAIHTLHLDEFDPLHACETLRETDLELLPLLRRGVAVAGLALLGARTGEPARRLLFGLANQAALHLDRILTVREAERGRFRAILDSMPQAVFLTDPALRIVGANRAADRLRQRLGLPRSGGGLERLGTLDVRPLAGQAAAGRPGEGELATPREAVFTVTVSTLGKPAPDPEGYVVVLADVTESRRLAQQLAQSEKLSSLGQMMSGVAHELNNPLASVVGYAQLVQDGIQDERLARRLAVIGEQATRCQRIVGNLLSFARRHEPRREPVALNDVVRSVASLIGYQLRVAGIRLEQHLDPDVPLIVGDQHQLQQLLVNLLTNAQQALLARDGAGRVRVTTRPGTGEVTVLEVEDDGPGIPEQIRGRVFEPFFTTKETGQGTGLGLSLVTGIVQAHDGRIHLGTSDAGGARFVIELPAMQLEAAAEPAEESANVLPGLRTGRILVVEDEPAVAALLCDVLTAEGHDVHPVPDGREALARLSEEAFDVIVSDLRMPVMGGARLLDEIRRRRPELAERLVLTTGDTIGTEPGALASSAGLPLLHKPFDLDDLKREVRSLLASP